MASLWGAVWRRGRRTGGKKGGRSPSVGRSAPRRSSNRAPRAVAVQKERPRAAAKTLTYAEELELGRIEDDITAAETVLDERRRALEDPAIACDPQQLQERMTALDAAQAEVDRLYARWSLLEGKRAD